MSFSDKNLSFYDTDVFFVGDETASHAAEVRRLKLAVDNLAAEFLEHTGQVDEGKLRGAGDEREHALAEKGRAEVDAVETTHQTVVLPNLDAGRKALPMEFGVGLDDIGSQPGTFLLIAVLGSGTTVDDTLEILVDGETEVALLEQLLHGVADVNLGGEDDKTL